MRPKSPTSTRVDDVLSWQCLCVDVDPQLYRPSPRKRSFLERVMRASASGRRLRTSVPSAASGIVQTCKARRKDAVREAGLNG